jgi:nucleotide-binding universal stress UspA family protein
MKIVAFVDSSLYAHSVIDHTIWLALERRASVELVHIVSPNEVAASNIAPIHPGGAVLLERDDTLNAKLAELERQGRERLEQAHRALNQAGVNDVQVRLCEGHTAQTMVQATQSASIAIVGKRGEHADLARLPLGANLERLVRGSKVPVLAVSRSFRPIRRALAPVDAEAATSPALEVLAGGLLPATPIELLHVGDASEAARLHLDQAAAKLEAAGFASSARIEAGAPNVVIPQRVVLDDIDMLAVTAFGSSRLKSMLLGSLTSELLRACQVPVLLC